MAQLTCKNLTLGYDNRAIQEDLKVYFDENITSFAAADQRKH